MSQDSQFMQALDEMKKDLEAERLEREELARLFAEHMIVCNRQKETLDQVAVMLEHIHASYKISNVIRKIILWVAPLVVAGIALWKSWTGKG